MKWRILAGILAMCMLTAGCGLITEPAESVPSAESTDSTTAAPTTTTTTTAAPTTTTQPPRDRNPFTGLEDLEPGASTRPIGIMVGNDSKSRPQLGIEKADWYFEAETEGGITRIMAVFANPSRVPSSLGPVRSARTPFVLLAQSLDLIYAHAGGSVAAKAALAERDLADIDALVYDGSYFWRDKGLRAEKGYEYSLITSGSKLTALAKKRNFRTTGRDRIPFTFEGDPATGDKALTLECKVSRGQTVNFKYYPDEGLYYKRTGTLKNPSTHATASGVQLSASNVIVLFDRRYAENATTISFDLESGNGLLFTAGRVRDIRWKRTAASLTFTETDGSAARVSEGKSYILLVDRDLKSGTTWND